MAKLRERLEEVVARFSKLEAAVFTSFNFNAEFFEENVLPVVLGIESASEPSSSRAARRARVHQRLAEVPVGVCFDSAVTRGSARDYRYTAFPMQVPGRFFHPKNIFLLGTDEHGERWLYISAASANLSLSGWGVNVEAFSDVWIHARNQQPWTATYQFLAWLLKYLSIRAGNNPLAAMRAGMQAMRERIRLADPEGGDKQRFSTHRLYFSPLHKSFAEAVREWYPEPVELTACSPYWGSVASRVTQFGVRSAELIPSFLPRRGVQTGLSVDEYASLDPATTSVKRWKSEDERFRHLKVYRFTLDDETVVSAVGSCNFTAPGLVWSTRDEGRAVEIGNVESMLLMHEDVPLPTCCAFDDRSLASEGEAEEGIPEPSQFRLSVLYDWKTREYRWNTHESTFPPGSELRLRGVPPINPGVEPEGVREDAPGPAKGKGYEVRYTEGGERRAYHGWIIELNLDYSTRQYGHALTTDSILASWRAKGDSGPPLPPGVGDEDGTDEGRNPLRVTPNAADEPAVFNFHQFYRAVRELEGKLGSADDARRREWLVSRPDSVMALANHAHEAHGDPIQYLILSECGRLLAGFGNCEALAGQLAALEREKKAVEARVTTMLEAELKAMGKDTRGRDVLKWFARRLKHWGVES